LPFALKALNTDNPPLASRNGPVRQVLARYGLAECGVHINIMPLRERLAGRVPGFLPHRLSCSLGNSLLEFRPRDFYS